MGKKNSTTTNPAAPTISPIAPAHPVAGPSVVTRRVAAPTTTVESAVSKDARSAKPSAPKVAAASAKAAGASTSKNGKSAASNFSESDVALRAYFIAEKRRADGLPGDEYQDWIEAERQLRTEAKPAARSRKKA